MVSVGADAWLWRRLMGEELKAAGLDSTAIRSDDALAKHILKLLYKGFGFKGDNTSKKLSGFWSMDQIMLGCVVKHLNDSSAPEYGAAGRLDIRSLPRASKYEEREGKLHFRFDRARWPAPGSTWTRAMLIGKTDAHLIRPGFGDNWESRLKPLVGLLTTPAQLRSLQTCVSALFHPRLLRRCRSGLSF